jgi:flagellar hook-length control protein FliK
MQARCDSSGDPVPSPTSHVQPGTLRPAHNPIEHRGAESAKGTFAELLDASQAAPDQDTAPAHAPRNNAPDSTAPAKDRSQTNSAGDQQNKTSDATTAEQTAPASADANAAPDPQATAAANALTKDPGEEDTRDAGQSAPTTDKSTDAAPASPDGSAALDVQTQAPVVATIVPVAATPPSPQPSAGAATPADQQIAAIDATAANAQAITTTAAATTPGAQTNAKPKAAPKLGAATTDAAQASGAAADDGDTAGKTDTVSTDAAAPNAKPAADHPDKPIASAEFEKLVGGKDAKDAASDKVGAKSFDATAAATDTSTLAAARANSSAQPLTATSTNAAAQSSQSAGPQTVVAAAVPIAGLAVEIATQARDGKNRFEIRLDPPELGRIDVRLDVDKQGNVTSRLMVERADTLDLLRRDASGLERALSDAGLKTSDNGLQFSLRDQSFAGGSGQRDAPLPNAARVVVPTSDSTPIDTSRYRFVRSGGVDIRV